MSTEYDIIVVGSGAASATFVHDILKKHPTWQILIVESGEKYEDNGEVWDAVLHSVNGNIPGIHTESNTSPTKIADTEVYCTVVSHTSEVVGGAQSTDSGILLGPSATEMKSWPQKVWNYEQTMKHFGLLVRRIPHENVSARRQSTLELLITDACIQSYTCTKQYYSPGYTRTNKLVNPLPSETNIISDFHFTAKQVKYDRIWNETATPFGVFTTPSFVNKLADNAMPNAAYNRMPRLHRTGAYNTFIRGFTSKPNVTLLTHTHCYQVIFNDEELEKYRKYMTLTKAQNSNTAPSMYAQHFKATQTLSQLYGIHAADKTPCRDVHTLHTRTRSEMKVPSGAAENPDVANILNLFAEEALLDLSHPLSPVVPVEMRDSTTVPYIPTPISARGVRVLMDRRTEAVNKRTMNGILFPLAIQKMYGGVVVQGKTTETGNCIFSPVDASHFELSDPSATNVHKPTVSPTGYNIPKAMAANSSPLPRYGASTSDHVLEPMDDYSSERVPRQCKNSSSENDDDNDTDSEYESEIHNDNRCEEGVENIDANMVYDVITNSTDNIDKIFVEFRARRYVVICTDAIETPRLLLRSGIGDSIAINDMRDKKWLHTPRQTQYVKNPHVGLHLKDNVFIEQRVHCGVSLSAQQRHVSAGGTVLPIMHMVVPRLDTRHTTAFREVCELLNMDVPGNSGNTGSVTTPEQEAMNKEIAKILCDVEIAGKLTFMCGSKSRTGAEVELPRAQDESVVEYMARKVTATMSSLIASSDMIDDQTLVVRAGLARPVSSGAVGFSRIHWNFLSKPDDVIDLNEMVARAHGVHFRMENMLKNPREIFTPSIANSPIFASPPAWHLGRMYPEFPKWCIDNETKREWLVANIKNENSPTGTTRMADKPTCGVVSPTLRVYGVSNLYIASTAVFPDHPISSPSAMEMLLGSRLSSFIHLLFRLNK